LANEWTEVKKRCRYFCLLLVRDLLGERPNVTEPARANSKTQLNLNSLKRITPQPAESPVQELEPGFLQDVISLSDSVNDGEEEEHLDKFKEEPKEEVEIIGFKSKPESELGKGKELASEGKEKHNTGIAHKSCSKHDCGKLPLSVS